MTAAADVIERVAAAELSDPATDDLTVPLAVQLAEASARLSRLEAALREARGLLGDFACEFDTQIYGQKRRAEFDLPDDAEFGIVLTARHERAFWKALATIDAALAPAAPAGQEEGGER